MANQLVSFQDGVGVCNWCRDAITYGIASTGPWMLDRDHVQCAGCGAIIGLELTFKGADGVRVHLKPLKAGNGGGLARGTDAGGPRDFINETPLYAGTTIERRQGRKWVSGRYEWTGDENEAPMFYSDNGDLLAIESTDIIRIK